MTLSPRAAHIAYYAAHFGKSLLWTASDLVTIYALVSLAGVNPGLAGWLFLGGLAVNALADLAVGEWIDRRPRATPWLAGAGLLVAALAFPATMLAASAGTAALALATLAFRLGYAAYDVPHNALLSRLASTLGAATRLSRGRTIGTGVAAALVGWGLHETPNPAALTILLWTLAVGALLGGSSLLPLLVRWSIVPREGPAVGGPGLSWPFLIGSVVGIVALGAAAKAVLHLPAAIAPADAGLALIVLTAGRTAAAFLPIAFADVRRGCSLLAAMYFVAAPLTAGLLWQGGWLLPAMLGLLMGATNLIGWALLPLLARGARSFGLYTMASKLSLGLAGLAMTLALGGRTQFTPGVVTTFAIGVIAACVAAAMLLIPRRRLTSRPARGVDAA